jgi:hypothetical protein
VSVGEHDGERRKGWSEVYLDGRWRTTDARQNHPRIGRIVIGNGRDTIGAQISTAFGVANLLRFEVPTDEKAGPRILAGGVNARSVEHRQAFACRRKLGLSIKSSNFGCRRNPAVASRSVLRAEPDLRPRTANRRFAPFAV